MFLPVFSSVVMVGVGSKSKSAMKVSMDTYTAVIISNYAIPTIAEEAFPKNPQSFIGSTSMMCCPVEFSVSVVTVSVLTTC